MNRRLPTATMRLMNFLRRWISILVREKFFGTNIENLSTCNDEIQSCAVEIPLNHGFLLVIGICHPHSGTVPNFNETLESSYERPDFQNRRNIFIAVGFGINILNENNSNVINFTSSVQSKSFLPAIKGATRFSLCDNTL